MFKTIQDYQDFYKTREGRFAIKILKKELFKTLNKRDSLLGIGYTIPFVRKELNVISSTTKRDDLKSLKNNVIYSHVDELPLESNSYDQVVMMHCLENTQHPVDTLKDAWRVLKSGGKLVMVVSNRRGLWSRSEHTPFGQGVPFSSSQVMHLLSCTDFACEDIRPALFLLPTRRPYFFKFSWLFQKIGKFLMVFPGGVHIVIAQKQIYNPVKPSKGSAVPAGIKKTATQLQRQLKEDNKDAV